MSDPGEDDGREPGTFDVRDLILNAIAVAGAIFLGVTFLGSVAALAGCAAGVGLAVLSWRATRRREATWQAAVFGAVSVPLLIGALWWRTADVETELLRFIAGLNGGLLLGTLVASLRGVSRIGASEPVPDEDGRVSYHFSPGARVLLVAFYGAGLIMFGFFLSVSDFWAFSLFSLALMLVAVWQLLATVRYELRVGPQDIWQRHWHGGWTIARWNELTGIDDFRSSGYWILTFSGSRRITVRRNPHEEAIMLVAREHLEQKRSR